MPSRLPAVLAVVVGLLALTVPSAGAAAGPVSAKAKPAAPGSLTGYGFDTCAAPPQAGHGRLVGAVAVLRRRHLHRGQQPGVQGPARAHRRAGSARSSAPAGTCCRSRSGPQASCSGYADRMSSDLATAEQQGSAEAASAVATARRLSASGRGSTLYYDLEDYDIGPDDCRRAALNFISGWTEALHATDYDSGRLLQHRRGDHLARPRRPGPRTAPTRCRTTSGSPGPTAGPTRSPTTGSRATQWNDHAADPPVRPRRAARPAAATPLTDRRQLARRRQGLGRSPAKPLCTRRRRRPAPLPDAAPGLARSRGRGGAVPPAQAPRPWRPTPAGSYDAPHGQGREEGAAEAGPEADRQGHPPDLGGAAGPGQAAAGQGRLDR